MAINLDSVFHMCRLVIPQMKKRGDGSIVNVTSISGFQGLPGAHTDTAAKGAAINLTRSLGITYCGDNIRVNCIARDLSTCQWSPRCSASSMTRDG
jgi:NAD(P)-dependent dehydrogenase (short-subunit alcohol dehydrogenase family)